MPRRIETQTLDLQRDAHNKRATDLLEAMIVQKTILKLTGVNVLYQVKAKLPCEQDCQIDGHFRASLAVYTNPDFDPIQITTREDGITWKDYDHRVLDH